MDKDTSHYTFTFSMSENGNRMVMDLKSELEQGELNVWFGGAGYQVIGNYTGERNFAYERVIFGPLNDTEPVTVKITAKQAAGTWSIRFQEISTVASLASLLLSGCLVILLTIGITLLWKKYIRAQWRWLLVGAGVWFVGVIFKFVAAYFANAPILELIKSILGNTGYLVIGSSYIGLLTGVFEIGMTLVFALMIKKMYENAQNALSIGLGAGLIEALLIGFASIGNYLMVIMGTPHTDTIMNAMTRAATVTPLLVVVSPVERIIAILCHTSSRMLVLSALAQHRQRLFWTGFLILSVIDAIAGYFHLSGLLNKISTWWIELLLIPFAIISIPIIRWCLRNWRRTDTKTQPPMDSELPRIDVQ
jgi:uncharacterized membrane protein YhfC